MMGGYHSRPVVSLSIFLLVATILACAIGPPGEEEDETTQVITLSGAPCEDPEDSSEVYLPLLLR
jgi:hypothetical protein